MARANGYRLNVVEITPVEAIIRRIRVTIATQFFYVRRLKIRPDPLAPGALENRALEIVPIQRGQWLRALQRVGAYRNFLEVRRAHQAKDCADARCRGNRKVITFAVVAMTSRTDRIIERRIPGEEHLGQKSALREGHASVISETSAQRLQTRHIIRQVVDRIAAPNKVERRFVKTESLGIALHEEKRVLTTGRLQVRQRQIQTDKVYFAAQLLSQ